MVYEQLRQLPKDFFTDDLSKVSFIADSLHQLFSLCDDERVPRSIKARVKKLQEMLLEEYDFKPKVTLDQKLV